MVLLARLKLCVLMPSLHNRLCHVMKQAGEHKWTRWLASLDSLILTSFDVVNTEGRGPSGTRTVALDKVKAPAVEADGGAQILQPLLDIFPHGWLHASEGRHNSHVVALTAERSKYS